MSESKPIQYTLSILLILCLGHFLVDFMLGIWPVFKTMKGLDLAMAGLVAGSCSVLGEGLQGYFGALCDKGYKRLLLLIGIGLATCVVFLSYTASFVGFFMLFMCTCIGSAAFHPTAASILSNLHSKNPSAIMGFFTASGMIGLGISQLTFSWTHQTFEGSTAILAVPSLALALFAFSFLRGKIKNDTPSKRRGNFSLYLQFLKVKELRALYLSMLGNQVVLWSLVFLLPEYLLENGYASWIVFGGGHLFLMLGATVGPPIFGLLADKTSPSRMIIICSLSTLLCFYFLLLPITLSEGSLFPLLFFLGSTLGSVPPIVWALGGKMVPTHTGAISAFLMGFVWIFSESVGLGLSGFVATLFETNPATSALALMGSIQFVSCFANAKLPKVAREIVLT